MSKCQKGKKPQASEMERRDVRGSGQTRVELRAAGDGMPTLVGYAAVFNSRASLGWFDEEILPGAFSGSLAAGDDVRALFNHDSSLVLGRRSADTLRLVEDSIGLRIEIDLPDTTQARDLVANIEAGNIDGMSFGFRAKEQEWIEREDEPELRRLVEVELIEVSAVTFPVYADTAIAKRSRDAALGGSETLSAGESRHHKPMPSAEILRLRASWR